MPSIIAVIDSWYSKLPTFQSLTSLASAAAGGPGGVVPMFGRQVDGDLTNGNYNIAVGRNTQVFAATASYYANSVLTGANGALSLAAAGQYVWHPTTALFSRVNSFRAGQVTSGTASGTTISGLSPAVTSKLAVGQSVFGSSMPAAVYVAAIPSTTSITLSAAATANGATGTLTFGDYVTLNMAGIATGSGTAVFQTSAYPRRRDMPGAKVTGIAADNKTLTLSYVPFGGAAPAAQANEFYPGDILLIISQMGDATAFSNVGNYELVSVASVVGTTLTLRAPLLKNYGRAADNVSLTGQTVNVYRVPEYRIISNLSLLTAPFFNYNTAGMTTAIGGVLPFMADTIDTTGTFDASTLGHSRNSGVTYYGNQVTNDAVLSRLLMGEGGADNGISGGGAVFVSARNINQALIQNQGFGGVTGAGGAGGTMVVVCDTINVPQLASVPNTLSSPTQGSGATLAPAGKIKVIGRTQQGVSFASTPDGAGNFTTSNPAGYKQTL